MGDVSKNFCYAEFFVSDSYPDLAKKSYDDEYNNELLKEKIKLLCLNCVQPVRDYVNKPVQVLSGYRDRFLNQAVGGVETSDHCEGLACDITTDYDLYQLYKWCVDNLCYRQIIYYPEQDFIHLSTNWFDKEYKHIALVKVGTKYLTAKEYYISKS